MVKIIRDIYDDLGRVPPGAISNNACGSVTTDGFQRNIRLRLLKRYREERR